MKENYKIKVKDSFISLRLETENYSNPVVLFITGTSGGALTDRFQDISKIFADNKYTFVRFNFRGYEKNNSLNDYSLNDEIEDMISVVNFLNTNKFNTKKLFVVAKSFGATRICGVVNQLTITSIGYISPAITISETETFNKNKNIKYKFIDNIESISFSPKTISKIKIPTIIFHSESDTLIPISKATRFYNLLNTKNKKFVSIKNEDHSVKDKKNLDIIYTELINFFNKFQ